MVTPLSGAPILAVFLRRVEIVPGWSMSVDVLVVGAGPAGCAAAIAARRHALDVLVVDKAAFPRDKTCGDGLTTAALRLLEDLEVDAPAVPGYETAREVVLV